MVIVIDEIDPIKQLKQGRMAAKKLLFSTDEFFAAIRACFNRGAWIPG